MKMCKNKRIMNDKSIYLLEKLLWVLHEADSEEDFYRWYKQAVKYLKRHYEAGCVNY